MGHGVAVGALLDHSTQFLCLVDFLADVALGGQGCVCVAAGGHCIFDAETGLRHRCVALRYALYQRLIAQDLAHVALLWDGGQHWIVSVTRVRATMVILCQVGVGWSAMRDQGLAAVFHRTQPFDAPLAMYLVQIDLQRFKCVGCRRPHRRLFPTNGGLFSSDTRVIDQVGPVLQLVNVVLALTGGVLVSKQGLFLVPERHDLLIKHFSIVTDCGWLGPIGLVLQVYLIGLFVGARREQVHTMRVVVERTECFLGLSGQHSVPSGGRAGRRLKFDGDAARYVQRGALINDKTILANAPHILHIHLLLEHLKALADIILLKWIRLICFRPTATSATLEHLPHILVIFLLPSALMDQRRFLDFGVAQVHLFCILPCLKRTGGTGQSHTILFILLILLLLGNGIALILLGRLLLYLTFISAISRLCCRNCLENGTSLPCQQI